MCPSTSWPLSSLTRNIVLGKASVTSPSTSMVSSFTKRLADHRHVGGFHALLALLCLELDLLTLLQVPVTASGDVGEVDEEVGAPVLGGDESEPLRSREPFHCASGHEALLVADFGTTQVTHSRSHTHVHEPHSGTHAGECRRTIAANSSPVVDGLP